MYVNGKRINTTLLTSGEVALLQRQYNMPTGRFNNALWLAIERADSSNLSALAKGFPSEVGAYVNYIRMPGYWERLLLRAGLVDNDASLKPNAEHPHS